MKSTCKTCGKTCEGDYCFSHKPRKPLAKVSSFSHRKLDKNDDVTRKISELRNLFLHIWNKRSHVSEVSGSRLGNEPLTIFFHHILPKEKYPQAALDEDNIILLTFEEHDNVERDIYRYEEVNSRRNLLKLKYESS